MSFILSLVTNLRSNLLLYIICGLGIFAIFKYVSGYAEPKRYAIIGIALIAGSSFFTSIVQTISFHFWVLQVQEKPFEAHTVHSDVTVFMSFLHGILNAIGVGCLIYSVLVDKMKISLKKTKKNSYREMEEERQNRRNRRDDEEEDDRRPRKRRRKEDDDDSL